MSNGTVKIGISQNVPDRVKAVEYETHLQVVEVFYLTVETRKKALAIEIALHKYFSPQCTQGEFFLIDFSEACNQIKNLVAIPEIEELPAPNLDFEKLQFLNDFIKNCAIITDKNLRDEIIKTAFNLLKI